MTRELEHLDVRGLHNIMDGFYAFRFLHAAVEFDLFTLLGKDGLTREEIVEALQIAEHPARILLLGGVSLGLMGASDSGGDDWKAFGCLAGFRQLAIPAGLRGKFLAGALRTQEHARRNYRQAQHRNQRNARRIQPCSTDPAA